MVNDGVGNILEVDSRQIEVHCRTYSRTFDTEIIFGYVLIYFVSNDTRLTIFVLNTRYRIKTSVFVVA